MPILSGIFKSSEKSINQIGSELSNENIRTISAENLEKLKDNNKAILSELIPIAKTKKSIQCFQLHSYDNAYIRRVIHPIKEEEPKVERRRSLKNELFKNLRINTLISGIKGSLNSAPVKEDIKNNKNLYKNGPKTATIEKDFKKLNINKKDEVEVEHQELISNNDNNNISSSNIINSINNSNSIILSNTDMETNQSLGTLSNDSLKFKDNKLHENINNSSNIFKSNNNSLSVIHEYESTEISMKEIDRSMSCYSENDLPKKKANNVELTIDTSQPKEKKKKKLTTILTPNSKSLSWLKEKKKNKKHETINENILKNKENEVNNKSQSVPNSGNNFSNNPNSDTNSSTFINSSNSNYNRFSDMEDNVTLTSANSPPTSALSNESTIKSPKKKKLYFNKDGTVIGKIDATDVRIISKMYNEDKEDFHKRVEFDFICTESKKLTSYNYYFYSPTDLIYNNSKAFFFYEPTIAIGSLKDILKNSKGFIDEMDIYVEEMLCTFKKLVNAVYWLHSTYQVVHRRIDPNRILFDTSGQFKLTGLEWAFHLSNHESINIQEEYHFHEDLIQSHNNHDKNDPIFFAPEICELNSDYFSKISTKIDVYSCGMILAAMNFGYSNVTSKMVEQEQQKKYCLNNNFTDKDDVKFVKHRNEIPEIMNSMLKWKPYERITLKDLISTEWFKNIHVCYPANDISIIDMNTTYNEVIHTHLNIPGKKCKSRTM